MAVIRAVFFDLDGTLVDGEVTWRASVSQTIRALSRRCPGVDPGELESAYYRAAALVWEVVKDGSPPSWGSMEAECVVREVWAKALERLSVTDQDIVTQAVTTYYAALGDLGARAYPDVVECLNNLQDDYQLGVITNGVATIQELKICSAGLARYFKCLATPEVGSGKPHRPIFEHALKATGVGSSHSAYVGDSLAWDVRGANSAGMVSVWLNRTGVARECGDPVPNAEILSLTELPPLLAAMGECEQ